MESHRPLPLPLQAWWDTSGPGPVCRLPGSGLQLGPRGQVCVPMPLSTHELNPPAPMQLPPGNLSVGLSFLSARVGLGLGLGSPPPGFSLGSSAWQVASEPASQETEDGVAVSHTWAQNCLGITFLLKQMQDPYPRGKRAQLSAKGVPKNLGTKFETITRVKSVSDCNSGKIS